MPPRPRFPPRRRRRPNIAFRRSIPKGRKFVAIAIGITVLLGFILKWEAAGWLMGGVTLWVAAFFRDPDRTTPQVTG